MAGCYDSEQQWIIDRIKCVACRGARDAGAAFFDRKWIAQKLHRSVRWVTDNWLKTDNECWTDFGAGRPLALSQESHNIVETGNHKQRKSCREISKQLCRNGGRKSINQQSIAIGSTRVWNLFTSSQSHWKLKLTEKTVSGCATGCLNGTKKTSFTWHHRTSFLFMLFENQISKPTESGLKTWRT